MSESEDGGLLARLELSKYAEARLGARGWFMFSCYGRVMSGQFSGRYVSGLPLSVARELVDALASGETLDIHLMHKHRSGVYESSQLRLRDGRLEMHFADRVEYVECR